MNYLLQIGDCLEKTIKLSMNQNIFEELIEIKDTMLSKSTNLDEFINEVYLNISMLKLNQAMQLKEQY